MKTTKNGKNTKSSKKVPKSKPKVKKPKDKKRQEEVMDRSTLVGITSLVKKAGGSLKALKSDTDEQLQKKVNEALHSLPSPEVVKLLESVDPAKLVNVLKRDCLGVFVDLSDVSCVRCSDVKTCVGKFIDNLRDGFSAVKGAVASAEPDVKVEEPKAAVVPVTRYEPDRLVFVRDVKNPNPPEDDYHDTIQRVIDDQPGTLGELRAIVEQDFDLDTDKDFMKFVTALRDPREGVIKLEPDLSEKDKAALRKAGYEI